MGYGIASKLLTLLVFAAMVPLDECRQHIAVETDRGSIVRDVELSFRSVKKHLDSWEVEIETRNNSQEAIYVLSDPKQANGEAGPYVDIAENDDQTLVVSVRFYKGPPYFLNVNVTRARLKRLEPHTSLVQTYGIRLPLHSTVPPYGNSLGQTNRPIDPTKIKRIMASVAVLPDDEGVRTIAQRKPLARFPDAYAEGESDGNELLSNGVWKGKPLVDIQSLINGSYPVN